MTANTPSMYEQAVNNQQLILKANPRNHFYVILSISGTHVDITLVGRSKIIMTLKLI